MSTLLHTVSMLTGEDVRWIDEGYVIFDEGKFLKIASGKPMDLELEQADHVIDGTGKWLFPGFVNTHGHAGMSLLRGYSDDLPLDRWLQEKMWPFEAKLDKASVKAARNLAMLEMIRSGTTTFLEMYHLFMNEFAEDIERVGLRATLMRSMIGLCSEDEQVEKLKEATDFAKTWHNHADSRIKTMLAPHAPYTCPPTFIERIVEEAIHLDVPIHMHLAETRKEVREHIQQYHLHPLEHLEKMGVLEEARWVFAHGVHLNEEHIDLLGRYQLAISHNPISNLKLGSGVAPISRMLQKGVKVGIGTDSVASNNTLDMIEEMRMAAFIHKGIEEDPILIPVETAIEMATKSGADILEHDHVGMIKEGYEADFILLDASAAHLQPKAHPLSHLVYAAKASDVTDMYVKGQALMRNKELLTLDEEKIKYDANQEFRRIQSLI
ncbi:amidohydrolase [Alkalihalophilus sp. As8PL]|uniref:5-methylthioadenosine/S-adenosylhomocysteine deaminase n=1 Tax=Alkalihalophilus sp. As8PL TaxID=3237103 RepID=A0AB39BTS2_9BACI